MKLYDFLQFYNESIPSVDFWIEAKMMSPELAEKFRNNFVFYPIMEVNNATDIDIKNVGTFFNVNNIYLPSSIKFIDEPWMYKDLGTIVASIDTEYFILKNDGSIILVDGYNWNHTLFDCAQSEEMFYDALVACIPFHMKILKEEPFEDKWRDKIIRDAATAAGGMKYYDFYDAYLG